jgi:hypothetical protein
MNVIKDQADLVDYGQQEEPLPAVPGESFKTMLYMGTPRLAQGGSSWEEE